MLPLQALPRPAVCCLRAGWTGACRQVTGRGCRVLRGLPHSAVAALDAGCSQVRRLLRFTSIKELAQGRSASAGVRIQPRPLQRQSLVLLHRA